MYCLRSACIDAHLPHFFLIQFGEVLPAFIVIAVAAG